MQGLMSLKVHKAPVLKVLQKCAGLKNFNLKTELENAKKEMAVLEKQAKDKEKARKG